MSQTNGAEQTERLTDRFPHLYIEPKISSDAQLILDRPFVDYNRVKSQTLNAFVQCSVYKPLLCSFSNKIVIAGAGISGITLGSLLPEKVDNLDIQIYDRNQDFGGVWQTTRYPGVRCDVPSHAYQSTFEPNQEWSTNYAFGPEIRAYWEKVGRKHNLLEITKFRHELKEARWDDFRGLWTFKVLNLDTNEITEDEANFFICSTGGLSDPKIPSEPGYEDFKGEKLHTALWDESFDATGKRIAVIGNGASGVQILPEFVGKASHIDHYARKATWISESTFGIPLPGRKNYEDGELEELQDPDKYLVYRKGVESKLLGKFGGGFYGSEGSINLIERNLQLMYKAVGKDDQLFNQIVPEYIPGSRRLTPAPGYLESLTRDDVDFILSPVVRYTETGVVDAEGVERPVDAIISAVGYNHGKGRGVSPGYEIYGKYGQTLSSHFGGAKSPNGRSLSYFGISAPGFPNFFYTLGVNSFAPGGTLPYHAEIVSQYVAKVIRKVQLENIKSVHPKLSAARAFNKKVDEFSRATTAVRGIPSYHVEVTANGEKRVTATWPGSSLHSTIIRKDPRFEDFEIEYLDEDDIYSYFGNGRTILEKDLTNNLTFYLSTPGRADLRRLHESWVSFEDVIKNRNQIPINDKVETTKSLETEKAALLSENTKKIDDNIETTIEITVR